MNNEPLPTIAVLGAGPVGLEAALYARFLGYPVTVFEQGGVCENVVEWGHVTLFTPFGMNHSPLGLSAIRAQFESFDEMAADRLHSGSDWIDRYLEPLSETDLLRGNIRTQTRIRHVTRAAQLPTDNCCDPARTTTPFRILLDDVNGHQSEHFDFVIDATGTWNQPNWMGSGGGPACGEESLRNMANSGQISTANLYSHGCLEPRQLNQCAGDRFLIVGNGYTAATNLRMLESMRTSRPDLRCVWLTRPANPPKTCPCHVISDDPLPARQQLAESVNALAIGAGWLNWISGTIVDSVEFRESRFVLRISCQGEEQILECDHLLSNTGFHGEFRMLELLQLHRCYASGGPMNWAKSITGNPGDCMKQMSSGVEAVVTSEPGLFVIGSKSYGRDPRFLYGTGLQQIRDVFRVIVGRDSLDLYSTCGN